MSYPFISGKNLVEYFLNLRENLEAAKRFVEMAEDQEPENCAHRPSLINYIFIFLKGSIDTSIVELDLCCRLGGSPNGHLLKRWQNLKLS